MDKSTNLIPVTFNISEEAYSNLTEASKKASTMIVGIRVKPDEIIDALAKDKATMINFSAMMAKVRFEALKRRG